MSVIQRTVRHTIVYDIGTAASRGAAFLPIPEENSREFNRVMDHLDGYIGSGAYGRNKYWEYPWVLPRLEPEAGMRVLDAGWGISPFQFAMARPGCHVCGVDPSENACRE